jgi:cyclophilin family peptidyl-prolyl cis-trans isomerase
MIGRMRGESMRLVLSAALLAAAAASSAQPRTIEITDEARVRIETSLGDIVVELDPLRAPLTVQNFLQYVVDGHYADTVFHRVSGGFLVQGGGYTADLQLKPAERTVVNESGNGLSNLRGTIAMARGNDPHAANSQFYFNLANNPDLDPRPTRWGYAVFGRVIEGMDVVDAIGGVPTGGGGEFTRDVPAEPIFIERIELIRD